MESAQNVALSSYTLIYLASRHTMVIVVWLSASRDRIPSKKKIKQKNRVRKKKGGSSPSRPETSAPAPPAKGANCVFWSLEPLNSFKGPKHAPGSKGGFLCTLDIFKRFATFTLNCDYLSGPYGVQARAATPQSGSSPSFASAISKNKLPETKC